MLCPQCKTPLSMADRAGIEIDYCPTCRGVWLDRGELDKIIERSAGPAAAAPREPDRRPAAYQAPEQRPTTHWQGERADSRHGQPQQPYRKRKSSFLSDLFEFD
ncbi:MAG: zf-TFIIB domain-containing protein [Thalassobaculales bacterium]